MNVNNYADYASKKQLEALKNSLLFLDKIFKPNIAAATKSLQDLPNYKEKRLIPANIATSINVSLENIKKEWKVDEADQQYLMYKNIVDIYFSLESALLDKFKLEEQIAAKENVVQNGSGDLQRTKDMKNELDKENQWLRSEKASLSGSVLNLQDQVAKLQNQLGRCHDSVRYFMDINKGLKQQINKAK